MIFSSLWRHCCFYLSACFLSAFNSTHSISFLFLWSVALVVFFSNLSLITLCPDWHSVSASNVRSVVSCKSFWLHYLLHLTLLSLNTAHDSAFEGHYNLLWIRKGGEGGQTGKTVTCGVYRCRCSVFLWNSSRQSTISNTVSFPHTLFSSELLR